MDCVGDTLGGDGAVALVEEKGGRWAVELYFSHVPDEAVLRDLIAQAAGERAARGLAVATLQARDWVKASLAGLNPIVAGGFVVHGRHDRTTVAANHIGIEVEAALAFGTGHHGTTRGCLIALDAIVKAKRRMKRAREIARGKTRSVSEAPASRQPRILDVGTGSGVLAIAAAKALRWPVLASDIDPTAVTAAQANVRLNGSASLVAVVRAAGVSAPRIRGCAPYDLLLANILLAPLKRLAAPMARVLAPGAHVILSGLLSQQANAAIAIYRAHGLALVRRIELDGWATLVMVRAPTDGRPRSKNKRRYGGTPSERPQRTNGN